MASDKNEDGRIDDAGSAGSGTGAGANGAASDGKSTPSEGTTGKRKSRLQGEELESRILFSATWIDADTDVAGSGPTSGADIYLGDEQADSGVSGGSGADVLMGLGGNDELDGGKGDDTVLGGDGDDTLEGGDGQDVLFGGDGDDTGSGGKDSDVLIGGAGDDTLSGGKGDDVLHGGEGDDELDGGDGADTVIAGDGDDDVDAGKGDDVIRISGAKDGDAITVDGGQGYDVIDLSEFSTSDITDTGGQLTVDLGNSESFTISYENVEQITTSDGAWELGSGSGSGGSSGGGSGATSGGSSGGGSGATSGGSSGGGSGATSGGSSGGGSGATSGGSSGGGSGATSGGSSGGGSGATSGGSSGGGSGATSGGSSGGGSGATSGGSSGGGSGATSGGSSGGGSGATSGGSSSGGSGGNLVANHGPSADAGADLTVSAGESVTLDATASSDLDGDSLSYKWTQIQGYPVVDLSSSTAASPTFTAPAVGSSTVMTFVVEVSDGESKHVDMVTITVTPDAGPVADAGAAQTVDEGVGVTLDATGSSDPDGDALTYTWSQTGGPTVSLSDASASQPTFTAPEGLTNTDLTFQVAVSDGANTSYDTVTITVNADNDAPTADAGAAQTVAEGDGVTLDATGSSDPEGEALSYTWSQTGGPTVSLGDASASQPTFTAPEGLTNTTLTFQVAASDGTNTSYDTVTITVNADNDAPTADAGAAQTVAEGDGVTLDATGSSDPEGQALTYTWSQTGGPTVSLSDTSASQPTFTAPEGLANTTLTFQVAASDGTNTSYDTVTITVNADNDAPTADAGAAQTVAEGDGVTLDATGSSDPEGQALTYTWSQTGGPTVSLSDASTSQPTFTAPEGLTNTTLTFQVAASDGTNTSYDTVTITVNADNDAPTADAGAAQTVAEGDGVTLDATGSSDPEGETLTYTWSQTGGPTVSLSDTSASQPTFTAPEGLTNTTLTFQVAASDGTNTSYDTVTITVNADNDAPTADAGAAQTVAEGDGVTLDATGSSDPEGEAISFQWVQTGGPAVTLSDANASSPTFDAPTVTSDTTITFELHVTDGTSTSVDTVEVTVENTEVPDQSVSGDEDSAIPIDLSELLAGGDIHTVTVGNVPDGATLSVGTEGPVGTWTLSASQAADVSVTPPEDYNGSFDLTVTSTVVDGATETLTVDKDNVGSIEGVTVTGRVIQPDGTLSSASTSNVGATSSGIGVNGANDGPDAQIGRDVSADASEQLIFDFDIEQTSVSVGISRLYAGEGGSAEAGMWTAYRDGVEVASGTFAPDSGNTMSIEVSVPDGGTFDQLVFEATEYEGGQNGNTSDSSDYYVSSLAFENATIGEGLGHVVHVDVVPVNDGPDVDAGADRSVDEGTQVSLQGSASDADGDALTYQWVQTGGPAVTLSDASAATPTFTAPEGLANSDLSFELRVSDGTVTSTDSVTITVNADNDAPTADAGAAQTVAEGDGVTLDATGSSDPEGQALTYTWSQTGGPTVSLSDASTSQPTFTAPEGLANTTLTFQVAASDGTNTSYDTVTITVNADNDAPTADAGAAQTVAEGDGVTLDATGSSDPEGQALTYTWSQTGGPTVSLSDTSASQPTFTAPEGLTNTTLTFQVAASDGTNTSYDTVTITVNADNDAPTADAGAAQAVAEGDGVTLDATGSSDPEGEALTYTWTQTSGPTVSLSDASASQPTFTAPEGLTNTTLTFQVAASDGTNTSYDTVTITVNADNDAPAADAGAAQTVAEGDGVTLDATGSSDPEGEALTYTWTQTGGPTVSLSDTSASQPTFTAPEGLTNTTLTFQVAASDGTNTSYDTVTITVNADNDAPTADAGAAQTVAEGDGVTLDATGSSDPEGEALTYTWTQTSGPTVSLSDASASQPTFTAPEGLANTTLTFQVAASDGTNTSYDTVTITVNADNDAPTADAGAAQTVAEGDGVTLDATGSSDPEGEALTYTWTQTGGPTVSLSDTSASQPTFTAPEGLTNTTLTFQVAASDGTNTSNDTVTITVNADNDAPTADAGATQTVAEGDGVTLDATGSSDPEGQALSYTWTQTGGPTVSLSDTSASQPTFSAPEGLTNTTLTFQVAASDGTNTSYDTVTITVNADNDAPAADAGAAQTVAEGDGVTLDATGSSDPEGEALTYTWTQTGGPTVSLSDTSASQPTFTAPEGLTNTTLTFQVAVSDGANTSYDTVTITVNADNDAPTADAGAAQTVAEGDGVTLDATGSSDPEGEALTYTWTQSGGPTVSLSDTSASQPTFTAPEGLTNTTLTFQVAASDGTNTSYDTVTITVNADNDAPTADAGAAQTVAEGDGVTLDATGSSDPEGQTLTYTWTQTGGPSVSLSDASASQPTFTAPEGLTNTTLTFQVEVSDGESTSVDTVTITVHADDDAPVADAGPPQAIEEGEVVTLDASGSTDSEGQALTYRWSQTGGPSVTLQDETGAQPTFTAPEGLTNTTLTFQVEVSDGTNTSVDTVTITVNADNDAPSANAGPDLVGTAGGSIMLDASRSTDPEGQQLMFMWRQISGDPVELSGEMTAQPMFTIPEGMGNSMLVFEVTVTDGVNASVSTVAVNVVEDGTVGLTVSEGAGGDEEAGSGVEVGGDAQDGGLQPEPKPDRPSDIGGGVGITVEDLPTLTSELEDDPQDVDPGETTMSPEVPGRTEPMFPGLGPRLEPDGSVAETTESRSNLEIRMQVDDVDRERTELSDEQRDSEEGLRRWQTHDDQFDARDGEDDANAQSKPGLFGRLWISLVVGLRSLLGGGSDHGAGR